MRKVRSRFLSAMILLSLPPLFLLGYVSFNIAKDTLKENNRQTNLDHLETSSEVADLLFRNVVNLNRYIVLNQEIREELRQSEVHNSVEQKNMNVRTINRLQQVMNNNSLDTRYVDSMCIIDLHFQTYCLGRSDDAGIYEIPNKAEAIQQTEWYKQALESQGKVEFFSYNVLEEKGNSFSTVKLFRDSESYNGDPLGILIVNLSKTMFLNIFNSSRDNGQFMAIESSANGLRAVYPEKLSDETPLGNDSLPEMLAALQKQGYLSIVFRNQTTGWNFIHLIKSQELLKDSIRIGTATTLIAFLIALFALAMSIVISGSITKPLLQIKKMMLEWSKGNREFKETFKDDEIGTLGETFKSLVFENQELDARLSHSELKEREAELRTLQAQIKPHFLYNTLDSIYLMAKLKKTDEVARMTLALSESFKLSLNKGKEVIPVFRELEHIDHYMTIQNIRYSGRFTFETEVDPSILGIEILKLILQPLVENAIYHGLEPKVGKGKIRLEGRKEGDFVLFVLEDDGVGMEDAGGKSEQGYGLRNVRERLGLYYGRSASMKIVSEPDNGTRIEIRILPFPGEAKKNA